MLQGDAALGGVGCVIFDEFHERSLNADLGLALCLESQETLREDLRLLVMSATLDLEPLSALLRDAPLVTAQGAQLSRSQPTMCRGAPRSAARAADRAGVAQPRSSGMTATFCASCRARRKSAGCIGPWSKPRRAPNVRVLPLYGDLSAPSRMPRSGRRRPARRKIVLATSIAETSLTIEGIRIVVDTGLSRYSEFDPASGMSRLVTGKVSQAAADQRRGRAGRLSDGVCYRLWSEGAHGDARRAYAAGDPERGSRSARARAQPAGGRSTPPACAGSIRRRLRRLPRRAICCAQLEAIDDDDRITAHGRQLAALGAHPRLAHMLAKGRELGVPRLACDLAAILSERDLLRAAPGARDVDLRLRVSALRWRGARPPRCRPA